MFYRNNEELKAALIGEEIFDEIFENAENIKDTDPHYISIPIGKSNKNDTYNLHFHNYSHIIMGGCNSGRTSLMRTLILNGSMRYTEGELEFWLSECSCDEEYLVDKLAGVRSVTVSRRTADYDSLCDFLEGVLSFINERIDTVLAYDDTFTHRRFNSIEFCNYKVREHNAGDPFSHVVVFVDNIEGALFRDFIRDYARINELVLKISMLGSLAGVHLVFFTNANALLRLKRAMPNICLYCGVSVILPCDEDMSETCFKECLEGVIDPDIDGDPLAPLPQGYAYVGYHGDMTDKVRLAFVPQDKFTLCIERIAQKRGENTPQP